MADNSVNPFAELPQTLVNDLLNQCDTIEKTLSNNFQEIFDNRDKYRNELLDQGSIRSENDFSYTHQYPTTCGVDGSYTIERLLSTDMITTAGVAVEGLTPPSEKRHWPEPRHRSKILTTMHNDANTFISRAIMMCMELELAVKAPHDVVFLDGSFGTLYAGLSLGMNQKDKVDDKIKFELIAKIKDGIDAYYEILTSQRSDKIYASLPKYTSRSEVTESLNLKNQEDRAFLSFLLKQGEYINPIAVKKPDTHWYAGNLPEGYQEIGEKVYEALDQLYLVYFRPYTYFPTLRVEVTKKVALNEQRLAILFEAIKLQCIASGIFEPYPLYLADRMVKHLRVAIPAIRKASTQEMAIKWDNEISNIYIAMHGYRTDWGK